MIAKNAVILTIDRLQAGMLGAYGATWMHTPQIDRLAAHGFVFDQAIACEPSLDAVFRSLWTTRDEPAWIEAIGRLGYHSVLLTDDIQAANLPLAQRFSERTLLELSESVPALVENVEDTQSARFFAAAIEAVSTLRERSVLWLHTRGLAGPWDAPFELREQYAEEEDPTPPTITIPPDRLLPTGYDPDELLGITQAYAGQVSLLDFCIGALRDAVAQLPDTMFVLLGVRGFPLGEHRRLGECDTALYSELVHVPWIVQMPDGIGALDRTSALVTHADLPTLVADSLGLSFAASAECRPLPLVQGERPRWRQHLILRSREDAAIRTPAWYCRRASSNETAKHELYVKPDDRWEVNDVADRCPEIVGQLADLFASPPREELTELSDVLVTSID